MRESTKWTVPYQFLNIFLENLKAIAISFVFLAAFYAFLEKPIIKEIASVIFIGVYFSLIYSRAHKFGEKERFNYTATKPDILKGVLFGVMLSLVFAAVCVVHSIIWKLYGSSGMLETTPARIYSVFFWIYTIPYSGIMGLAHGRVMWYSIVIMLIIPIAATASGYIAGLKRFSIFDKLSGLIYEKQDGQKK